MAETIEQKIKNLQFKRNKTIYPSLEDLIDAAKDPEFLKKPEIAEMQDGELLMFRYKDVYDNIATLVGCVYNPDEATKEIHLEISTDDIKKIIREELKYIDEGKPNIFIDSSDKILSLENDNILSANLKLVKSENTLKLIGKNSVVISTITLPDAGVSADSLSFQWLPEQGKLQLVSGGKTLSEVDFPFETMVKSSELMSDNKLKLVFNTTNGTQDVIVDLNKLKDIYTAGDSSISVEGNKISAKIASNQSSLPITKENDGLRVNDVKLTETVNNLNSLEAKVSNLETEFNKPKNPTGVNLLFADNIKFNNNSGILEQLLNKYYYIYPLKPLILNRANQVLTFSFSPGNDVSNISGFLGIALADGENHTIPLTIFSEGNSDVREAWSNDEDSSYNGVYLNLRKIYSDLLGKNSSYDKLSRIFITFGFRGSTPRTATQLILYFDPGIEPPQLKSINDPILEFGTVPSNYSIERNEFEHNEKIINNKFTSITNKITDIKSSIPQYIVTETDTPAINVLAGSVSDSSVLRFFHTGKDTVLSSAVDIEMPYLEYNEDGNSTLLKIDKYNSGGEKETIVELATKQDLTEKLTLDKLTPLLNQYHSLISSTQLGTTSNALSVYESSIGEYSLNVPSDKTILIRRAEYSQPDKTSYIFLGKSSQEMNSSDYNKDYLLFDSNPNIFKSLRKTIYNEKFYLGVDPSVEPVYANNFTGDNSILQVYADLLPSTSELWEFISSVNPLLRGLTSQSKVAILNEPLPKRMVFKYYNNIYEVTADNETEEFGYGITYNFLLRLTEVYNGMVGDQEIPPSQLANYKKHFAEQLDAFIRLGYIIKLTVV